MQNLILSAPEVVMEPAGDNEGLTCWAAALVSFLGASARAPGALKGMSQEGLVLAMEATDWMTRTFKHKQLVFGNGALSKDGLGVMLLSANLKIKAFPDIRTLTMAYVRTQLKAKGHLYLVLIQPGAAFSHAVVVYGFTEVQPGFQSLSVMDPWPGSGGLVQYDKADLRGYKQALLGWFD